MFPLPFCVPYSLLRGFAPRGAVTLWTSVSSSWILLYWCPCWLTSMKSSNSRDRLVGGLPASGIVPLILTGSIVDSTSELSTYTNESHDEELLPYSSSVDITKASALPTSHSTSSVSLDTNALKTLSSMLKTAISNSPGTSSSQSHTDSGFITPPCLKKGLKK